MSSEDTLSNNTEISEDKKLFQEGDMVNRQIEYFGIAGGIAVGFGNMKIFVDLKKHLDGKVNINKMEWVKECVRSKKVAMRDVVSLLKNFFL